ncbi:MAG: hypothetical protein CM15mV81_090 [uncultured marine virus]|nr:MAG: hypothetical protein CM15mV81_090 [uncultured marine virus]
MYLLMEHNLVTTDHHFALARIMPDQEMRESFLEYVERQILKVGNYTLTNTNHDRGELGERDFSMREVS